MTAKTLITVSAVWMCLAAGCARGVDIEQVPVGSTVQVTREDGGGAGTAVVLSTEGKPVVFSRGTDVRVRLVRSVQVRVPVNRAG